jgi:hypothetical protein
MWLGSEYTKLGSGGGRLSACTFGGQVSGMSQAPAGLPSALYCSELLSGTEMVLDQIGVVAVKMATAA